MKNRLFLILVFGGILLSCSNPSSEEKKYIKTNKAEIKTDANEDGKYSVIPIDSLTLRYTFNSNIPTQFKITNSIYYLGNGNSIMGFNSKGGKESEIRFSDEILKGRSFSDFEVSELFDNMYYLLLDGNLLLIDNNKEPQSVVFEQKAGEKFVRIKNDNFFIPYQKSDERGAIHYGLYKYSSSQSELVDFKPEIEFSGESFIVQNDNIYFVAEGNILYKFSVKSDNVSKHNLSGLPKERTWSLGFQNDKLFVKQISDKKRDIIYVLNGNDYLSENQYELKFDYKDINKELRENEDLTLENPSRVFNFNYKDKIYFLRITNDGVAKIYFLNKNL